MDFSKFNIIIPPQDIHCNPECLEKIAAGDKQEFEWLYKNYCSKIYNYILLLTNDQCLSEDIVQEVFLKIWNKREQLTAIKNFNTYVYFMAKNLLIDKLKKQQTEKRCLEVFYTQRQQTENNLFDQHQQQKQINAAIKTLTPKQELVYRMIREEGHSRNEVSKQLKISPHTVRNTMQNALHNLKKQLSER